MGAAFFGDMRQNLLRLPLLILSLSVHEFAHAWSAFKLGDRTAEREGRLTLNPMAHIDWVGTILLPLFGLPIGWAKPVPTQPRNFTRKVSMRTGSAIVASAGPLSNVALALISSVLLGVLLRLGRPFNDALVNLTYQLMLVNVGLAIFNLLPLPPLDGHYVVDALVRGRAIKHWETFKGYAPMILLVIILAPRFGNLNILGPVMEPVVIFMRDHIAFKIALG